MRPYNIISLGGYIVEVDFPYRNIIVVNPTSEPIKVVDGTIYGRDAYLDSGYIYSLQNNTLVITIKCHQGYVLDKYSILSSNQDRLRKPFPNPYQPNGERKEE